MLRVSRRVAACLSILARSEEHTSELQSHVNLVCRLLLEKKNQEDVSAEKTARQAMQDAEQAYGNAAFLVSLHSGGSFFFNDAATTEIYTLSLHDALPI